MNPISLVAFLLVKDKKVLMEIRKPTAMGAGETWFPGGHVEAGETEEQALFRELKKELDVVPVNVRPLLRLPWNRDGKEYTIQYYVCFNWKGEIVNNESAHFFGHPFLICQS
jgi:mutator protein MutT